jgi:hypothetical protein
MKIHLWQPLIDQESVEIILLDSRVDRDLVGYFRSAPEWGEEPSAGKMRIFRRLAKSLLFPRDNKADAKVDLKPYLSPV